MPEDVGDVMVGPRRPTPADPPGLQITGAEGEMEEGLIPPPIAPEKGDEDCPSILTTPIPTGAAEREPEDGLMLPWSDNGKTTGAERGLMAEVVGTPKFRLRLENPPVNAGEEWEDEGG